MSLVIGKVYVLSGWVFDSDTLDRNGGKFTCVAHDGDEPDPQYEFRGVEDGAQQWCYFSFTGSDDGVAIVEYKG